MWRGMHKTYFARDARLIVTHFSKFVDTEFFFRFSLRNLSHAIVRKRYTSSSVVN